MKEHTFHNFLNLQHRDRAINEVGAHGGGEKTICKYELRCKLPVVWYSSIIIIPHNGITFVSKSAIYGLCIYKAIH